VRTILTTINNLAQGAHDLGIDTGVRMWPTLELIDHYGLGRDLQAREMGYADLTVVRSA
jgi:hypothetical protein